MLSPSIGSASNANTNSSHCADSAFSAERWLIYFKRNKENRASIRFPEPVELASSLRLPLLRSLQRFQIGETGEGKHLRSYARTFKDSTYEECIDLFIKEEQSHARVLAEMIGALDGTLLTWHWTDLVFIGLRRLLGLKTEIFILLIAEIIGKTFYLECARHVDHQRMSDAFSILVLDEIAHLEFHCEFLQSQFKHAPESFRYAICWGWGAIFYAACFVFIVDHKRTLAALNVAPRDFARECSKNFNRAAMRALQV